jgi:hypothetical protein
VEGSRMWCAHTQLEDTMKVLLVALLISCASAEFARVSSGARRSATFAAQVPTTAEAADPNTTEAPTAAPSATPTSSPVGVCLGDGSIPSLDGSVCCPAECLFCGGDR